MRALFVPLRDQDLWRRLLAAARAEERSPAQHVLFLLRRALPPAPPAAPDVPAAATPKREGRQ